MREAATVCPQCGEGGHTTALGPWALIWKLGHRPRCQACATKMTKTCGAPIDDAAHYCHRRRGHLGAHDQNS